MPWATLATKFGFDPVPSSMCNATGNKANSLITHENVLLLCILDQQFSTIDDVAYAFMIGSERLLTIR